MATSTIKNRLANMQTSTTLLNGWSGSVDYVIDGKLMMISGSVTAPSSNVSTEVFQLPNSLTPKRFSVQSARDASLGTFLDIIAHTNGKLVIYSPEASHTYQFDFAFMLA